MDEQQLFARLVRLTGDLTAARGTPRDALERVRRYVAAAAADERDSPERSSQLAESLADELRTFARESSATAQTGLKVERRSVSSLVSSSAVPHAAHATESIGPFQSDDLDLVWFDVWQEIELLSVLDASNGRVLLSLPRLTLNAITVTAGIMRIEVAAGSVWLYAPLFDTAAPTGAFAGLRIEGGAIELSEPATVQDGRLRVTPGTTLIFRARVATAPLSTGDRRQADDARELRVELPREVTFTIRVGASGRLTELSDGALRAYDAKIATSTLSGSAAYFVADLSRLCFPLRANPGELTIGDARSALLQPSASARIERSAWALPVAIASAGDPSALGEPTYSGYLLELGTGLSATFEPLCADEPASLLSARLLAEPGRLTFIATTVPLTIRHELRLWQHESRRGVVTCHGRDSLTLRLDALALQGGVEVLTIQFLKCDADLDRPLTAVAARVPFSSSSVTLALLRYDGETRLFLFAPASAPRDPVSGGPREAKDVSFALSNALVRSAAPEHLYVAGPLQNTHQLQAGIAQLRSRVRFILPTLPDPYAANIYRHSPRRWAQRGSEGRPLLIARVQWTHEDLTLSFTLSGDDHVLAPAFMPIEPAPIERERARGSRLEMVEALFERASGQGGDVIRLLDVSSRADQFGIALSPSVERLAKVSQSSVTLSGLDLIAPARNVSAITLPAFQWEPVYNIPSPGAAPFPAKVASATDGGASRFVTPTATLVPLAPIPVVDTIIGEYRREAEGRFAARFTLPFGIVAVADLRKGDRLPENALTPPHVYAVRPQFSQSGFGGALQFALQAPAHLISNPYAPPPGLPGAATQTDNGTTGFNVLKSGLVDDLFNDTFANKRPMVPVRRIDFSGYGASTFSDWRRIDSKATGVTQVRFDAMIGRTAREVVQVRAKLCPWGARVVRIITMDRTGSGGVFRRDSGWQATSDADYNLDGCIVHPGVVQRLTNIRRIRDTSDVYERAYGVDIVKMTQVIFDADVEMEGVTAGANASRRVPVRDIVGYVQVGPVEVSGNIADLEPQWLDDLLQHTGPIGGAIDCEIDVGGSGVHMRVSRVEVDRTATLAGSPELAVAARGVPELAGAGQWTFAYRGPGEVAPHRLAPDRALPLVRPNPAGGTLRPYRFADASELHRVAQPHSEYSLLHSTGAQRLLLPQPQVRAGEPLIHAGSAPLLADMYALAGEVAFFPRADRCHPLPAGSALRITGRRKARLEIPPQPGLAAGEFKVTMAERVLAQSSGLRVRSHFHPGATIQLVIDSDAAPNWSCRYGPVSSTGDVQGLDGLMQVIGTMASDATSPPALKDPQLAFGGVLAPVQAVVDFLTMFGLPLPFNVDITNPSYTFKTGVKYSFPDYWPFGAIDHALKHGLGVMLEIELKASFGKESHTFGTAASAEHPIVGGLTPWTFTFEYETKLLTKCLNPLPVFLGGTGKFEIEGRTDGHESKVLFQAGFAGAVEADLHVVEVQGSRSYTLVSRVEREGSEVKVGIGVSTEWEVEGEFLDGLAAVALSFEMLVILERGDEFHCQGEAMLAIDVTLAWALSKTFEVKFTMNEQLALAAFAVASVLP